MRGGWRGGGGDRGMVGRGGVVVGCGDTGSSMERVADCTGSGRFALKAFICLYMGLIVCSSSQHTGSSFKV